MITVVSGMPDSGKRLLLNVLSVGGLPKYDTSPDAVIDLATPRSAVADNFPKKSVWLNQSNGKAILIDYTLLGSLDPLFRYRVIYLEKSIDELIRYHSELLVEQGSRTPAASARMIANSVHLRSARIKNWLVKQPNMEHLFLNRGELLASPVAQLKRIRVFLGESVDMHKMLTAMDQHIYSETASPML